MKRFFDFFIIKIRISLIMNINAIFENFDSLLSSLFLHQQTRPGHLDSDRYAGPSIADVAGSVKPAICAGMDNLGTMVAGSPDDGARQVADAIKQAGGRRL